MHSILYSIKTFILDPLGVSKIVNSMNAKASMLQCDIFYSAKRTEELTQLFAGFENRMEEHMFLRQVNQSLDYSVPDMFWVKDIHGKYLMANKAIRDKLLFDEHPFGKNDIEMSNAEIERVGKENHTFGSICGNSDLEVLKTGSPMKFNEDGLVSGKYMMLQVHKNVIRDAKGNIIGTCGVGRDVTHEIVTLTDIMNDTDCHDTKGRIEDLINHYGFKDRT